MWMRSRMFLVAKSYGEGIQGRKIGWVWDLRSWGKAAAANSSDGSELFRLPILSRVLRSRAGRLYGGFAAAYPDSYYSAAQEEAQSGPAQWYGP
jgi:hypothetical protein